MTTPVTTTDDKKALRPVDAFKKVLTGDNQREQIAAQLPQGVNVDRFIRTAMTVVSLNPELLNCTLPSLMGSIMLAAKDGLLPDGKEAVIQVYNCNIAGPNKPPVYEKQAQYMPMVRGLINILYRTGDVAMVDGVAVRAKDVFEYERGDAPRIVHKPYMGVEDAGPVIAAYCVIKLNNGEVKREVMNARDIAAVRAMSKSKNGPGWKNWEDQFAIKAVIKRAFKQLPTDSEDLSRVIEHDNAAMHFDLEQQAEPLKVEHKPGVASRLTTILKQQAALEPEPVATTPQTTAAEEPYFGDDINYDECPPYDR